MSLLQTPSAPSEDKRWKLVEATMRRYGYRSHALIETLHTVQESFGYLDDGALRFVAKTLHVPLSRAYGVATFYHYFSLKPPGEHTCVICLGTACYIKGAQVLINKVEHLLGIPPGETTPDKKVSFVTARCLGSCGLAPAAVFDGAVHGKLTVEQAQERIEEWLKGTTHGA